MANTPRITMSNLDIRWKQRLENFQKAFTEFEEAIQIKRSRVLSKLETQGLIQSFEYTHELAWTTLKDFFEYQGNSSIMGSRDASREAFKRGLIQNGEVWMDMIKSRNLSTHTYNKATAEMIVNKIDVDYFEEFKNLISKLKNLE